MPHPSRLRPRPTRAAAPLLLACTLVVAACVDDAPTAPEATPEATAADPSFVVTGGTVGDLGTLGGYTSMAYDMNEAGHVVGYAELSDRKKHAFIHTAAGGMRDLGTIGNVEGHESEATAVNRDGWVTGYSQRPGGSEWGFDTKHAFRWRHATGMQNLGTLGGPESFGADINDSGQVAGSSAMPEQDGYWYYHAFIHTPGGTMQDLGTLGGPESHARRINVQGVVIGKAQNAARRWRPFRWTAGGGMQDLAPSGGGYGEALDINDAGQIVATDSVHGAFVYTPGKGLQEIERADGVNGTIMPLAINNKGEVVGWMYTAGRRRAFRWTPAGGVQDLGTLGGLEAEARDINDGGDVTGWAMVSGSEIRPFIWTPGGGMREMANLGPPAYYWYSSTHYGEVINNKRQVAGVGRDPYGQPRAARWVAEWTETAPEITSIGGPYAALEGAPVRFNPTILNQDGDVLTYEWAFGNGLSSTVRTPAHKYADQGTYPVRLIVRDPGGRADTSTVNAEIRNAPPTGVFHAPVTLVEGRTFTLGFSSVTDPGPADVPTLQVSINCGTTFRAYTAALTGSCNAPQDQDTITIRARVKDKDGATREYNRVVPVTNAAPAAQLSAAGSTTIAPGGSVTVNAAFSDFGTLDGPWSWRITWGDGTATVWTSTTAQGALPSRSHVYAAPGTYAARLFVRDKDGAQGFSTPVDVVVQ
jgi:probable HAF family extracellular repeat protein